MWIGRFVRYRTYLMYYVWQNLIDLRSLEQCLKDRIIFPNPKHPRPKRPGPKYTTALLLTYRTVAWMECFELEAICLKNIVQQSRVQIVPKLYLCSLTIIISIKPCHQAFSSFIFCQSRNPCPCDCGNWRRAPNPRTHDMFQIYNASLTPSPLSLFCLFSSSSQGTDMMAGTGTGRDLWHSFPSIILHFPNAELWTMEELQFSSESKIWMGLLTMGYYWLGVEPSFFNRLVFWTWVSIWRSFVSHEISGRVHS